MSLPVIDVGALVTGATPAARASVAAELGAACRDTGFFYVTGHGIDAGLQQRLEDLSREFFDQDAETKSAIRMELGGAAWRGYFPLGAELTSGRPDLKEGLYFGAELPATDPRVLAGLPLHGPNLFPATPAGLRPTVLAYLAAMTHLGHALMSGIALSLDRPAGWFAARYTAEPLILFRIFNYPVTPTPQDGWGVGEHTDYGLLTMLKQDDNGGLQVRTRDGASWIDAPPVPGSFVCNLGDMLDRLTGGHYRSTPHRVLPSAHHDRLSWPFFFDPGWDSDVFDGTYGQYVMGKVGEVFPQLRQGRW